MRLSTYAAAIVGASLLGSAVALPVRIERDTHHVLARKRLERSEKKGLTEKEKQALKYFHEPGEGDIMGHYDARFFTTVVSDEERKQTQLHMIRAYLDFFREKGLDTWIAHGTLLGWWWNGQRLPWDWDMDTQVSDATLTYMGEKFNQTRHKYTPPTGEAQREYLLDVNPMIVERERGDGMNVIDARWIDVSNGLFIDITGLSETHPDSNPGQWSCKNYHRYQTSDLYPMRETMFEGAIAKVPYSYDKILIEEYQEKALVVTEFQKHSWNPQQKLWQKTDELLEQQRIEAEQRKQAMMRKLKEDEELRRVAAEKDATTLLRVA